MNPNLAARVKRGFVVNEKLLGLTSMHKIFENSGNAALISQSKLDLDTDGSDDPKILCWDSDHQGDTSEHDAGHPLDSNEIPYLVLPEGFAYDYRGVPARHRGIKRGCLCAVIYGATGAMEFAIYGDDGPPEKYGEGSIALHRSLGFERLRNGTVLNIGIDQVPGVTIVIFIGTNIGAGPFTAADIRAAAKPLWGAFTEAVV